VWVSGYVGQAPTQTRGSTLNDVRYGAMENSTTSSSSSLLVSDRISSVPIQQTLLLSMLYGRLLRIRFLNGVVDYTNHGLTCISLRLVTRIVLLRTNWKCALHGATLNPPPWLHCPTIQCRYSYIQPMSHGPKVVGRLFLGSTLLTIYFF
jgi:hypothetical protein